MSEPVQRQSHHLDDKSLYFKLMDQIQGSMWAIDANYQFILGNKKFLDDMRDSFGSKRRVNGKRIMTAPSAVNISSWKENGIMEIPLSGMNISFLLLRMIRDRSGP
jgi:hypothetical protein